ncbi:MAG: flagellar biosynthesis anti-sigma factor FlgM [Rhodocyclaceae bacterium]
MKIDSSVKTVGGLPSSEARARPTNGQASAPASQAGAKVELSSFSTQLQQIESAMATTPAVDVGRVDEIKQAITEGRFKVDSGKVADGLIKSVRQMLDRRAGAA